MKQKYEISIWNDIANENTGEFEEEKLIVIGSDTMTSESRAREPKLVTNINGTNKFTFNMYYRYIDTRTGEKIENPYIKYLINERKIKVLWKGQWYDFFIKQIKEDQVQHLFSYTCEDAFITELSRNGYNLTFDTELENNIGTARELIEKVIDNTDWRFDEDSDLLYQELEEPVYETTIDLSNVQGSIWAYKCPSQQLEEVNFRRNAKILVYYSCAQDPSNLKKELQFYYNKDVIGEAEWPTDENDMLAVNGDCYLVNVTWEKDRNDSNIYHAKISNDAVLCSINFNTGLSKDYRAKRYVQSQKSIYNNIVDRYVNVYNDGDLLGYEETQFNDASAVVNLITNPSNFSNTSGWIGNELYFKLSPPFDKTTDVSNYTATSYLYLKNGVYYNSGIQNNRPYIKDGFTPGERYIFRVMLKKDGDRPDTALYETNPDNATPSIQVRDADYNPQGQIYFKTLFSRRVDINDEETGITKTWLEYTMECYESCPYDMILSSRTPFGIFLNTNGNNYWLEEAQFFKEIYGSTGYGEEDDVVRIDPGQMNLQSISQSVWRYFDNIDWPEGTTKDNLPYNHISIGPWSGATPVNNNYEKFGTIEESNSNRFNILQSIAEKFECWIYFNVVHDDKGYIERDGEGRLKKFIRIQREAGQETGIGFVYGIDLKGVVRNIKSDKISSKTIVEQNENEFGKNGFCTIARSEQNYPRENFILNFDYYIQHGLLDKTIVQRDLYGDINSTSLNYFPQLHTLNVEYADNLDNLLNKKLEQTKQQALLIVYEQYISSSREEQENIEDSLKKLASTDDLQQALQYAKEHSNFTKVQALVNDRTNVMNIIRNYEILKDGLLDSLDALDTYIKNTQARQDEIIDELQELNQQFYSKYARYIQEGTWTSEDYWDDDLYYLDALQVAYTSSRPQISYEINVLRLSDLPDYSSKKFYLGDISFIQDPEYFGYKEDKITPYKEKVILTEITSYFETPDKDQIKVQNYKTQFDDLFQRITASVQSLEFNQGKYAKAANIMATDGTIRSSVIQNTFNENKDLVYGAQNDSATIDNTGITVTDNANGAKQVKVTSGGVFITDDGGATWNNAIRGDGITADVVTAGKLNTELVTIYGSDAPSFTWDQYGINAYMLDEGGHTAAYQVAQGVTQENFNDEIYYIKTTSGEYVIATEYRAGQIYYLQSDFESSYDEVGRLTEDQFKNGFYYIKTSSGQYEVAHTWSATQTYYEPTRSTKYNQFVRFDKYGIYGVKGKDNYRPASEQQIYQDANFGLTWNKFFMKNSSNGKYIEISTDRDIVVNDGNIDRIVIGRVDGANDDNYGIRVRRWNTEVTPNQAETIFECSDKGSTIAGWTLTKDYLESQITSTNQQTIRIQANGNIGCYGHPTSTSKEYAYSTSLSANVAVTRLKDNKSMTLNSGTQVYVFISQVGSKDISYQKEQTDTTTLGWDGTHNNSLPEIQLLANNEYYSVSGLSWSYSVQTTNPRQLYRQYTRYKTNSKGEKVAETVYVYVYSYVLNLIAKKGSTTIFSVTNNTATQQNFYIPAADTKWSINKDGQAIFHDIYADYGRIAGWFIDTEKIYQTTNGLANGPIKQQLSTVGSKTNANDYSFITDAINAAIAKIGGVNFGGNGLIDGVTIASLLNMIQEALSVASTAQMTANKAAGVAEEAKTAASNAARLANRLAGHTHGGVMRGGGSTDPWTPG